MSFNLLSTIAGLRALQQSSFALIKQRSSMSSDDFEISLESFEVEIDRLNLLLREQFGDDPEVMQLVFELKSVVIALKADNVEMLKPIVKKQFNDCEPSGCD